MALALIPDSAVALEGLAARCRGDDWMRRQRDAKGVIVKFNVSLVASMRG
ncbi:hypothetical protein EWM64_g8830 [Hericium alpestre]|uniref:Uncharacterized protein n=1 Tax=Hericium alpestre TaxID=135208 RepID=A0A4Y9ZKB6_9AGAM|nr:hypothetical protein EWM64_g8830 [Hericium alpestre]